MASDDGGRKSEMVTLAVEGGGLPLLDCLPSQSGPGLGRAVIILHDASGANTNDTNVTHRLAGQGFRAVLPHLYHRTGGPVLDYSDIDGMVSNMKALNEQSLLIDLRAVVAYLIGEGYPQRSIAVIGFCMGGTIGTLIARHLRLGAVIAYYGSGIVHAEFPMPTLLELAPRLQTPWIGLYGDLDRLCPVDEVELLRPALAAAPVATELHRYAEAGHAFMSELRPSYHEPSATDAWRRTIGWIDAHTVAAPG